MKRFLVFFLIAFSFVCAKEVGLCVMATGKYAAYAEEMISSARKHFLKNHKVTFFVFTDQKIQDAPDIVRIEQKRLGWPNDTLKRFECYLREKKLFENLDYIYACDADMLFVDAVGDEILSDLVGTKHPGYYNQRGTYEKNLNSSAYVSDQEELIYFAGGFYGGKREKFLHLLKTNVENIETDLRANYIAAWHDESHLNRYFINFPPTLVLPPAYCFSDAYQLPYSPKLMVIEKNHQEMRK
ncbi:MAG: hypothetical protein MRY21_01135 [Simkaniaceae bacterium]|nr:hypothetical protein [Simkaniaceae bacterium]